MKQKQKTNSGAKKRYRVTASGKIKRKQTKKRHLLNARSPKAKRQLSKTKYVTKANRLQVQRLLLGF